MSNTSYSRYVESIAAQYAQLSGQSYPIKPLMKPAGLSDQPRVLILAPHPDDECLMAGCALRMQEEWNAKITVVPFSFGSDLTKRQNRLHELKEALTVLRFDLLDPRSGTALDKLTQSEFLDAVKKVDPEILISPHLRDGHPTHIEAAKLAESAVFVSRTSGSHKIMWVQSEYWQAAQGPNFFVPLSTAHVVKIGQALMKHVGEVSRNPYHLSLPAWYMDQARRAPEVMNGRFGGTAGQSIFGQLLKVVI